MTDQVDEPRVDSETSDDAVDKRLYAQVDPRRMSVGWTRKYSLLSHQVRKAQLMVGGMMRTDLSVQEQQKLELAQLEATEELFEITEQITEHVAKILKDVPREWLSSDAPDALDWSDPASQDWLLPEYLLALSTDINQAIEASQKKAANYLRRSS